MSRRAPAGLIIVVLGVIAAPAARAQEPAEAGLPKVIVVVAGDPDERLRGAALAVEQALERGGRVTLPADGGLRDAFRGAPGAADDGLERARAERRRLGSAGADEHPVLQRIARVGGASAVVVIRAGDGTMVEVFDATAGVFYEGHVAATDEDALVAFVATRARRAHARAREPRAPPTGSAPSPSTDDAPSPSTDAPVPETAEDEDAASPEAAEPRGARAFFRKHWAYFVVGGLLVGAVTAAVITQRDTGSSQPVLRFRPGAN